MNIFPSTTPSKTKEKVYYLDSSITYSGDTDIQIKQKETANPLHYLIGIAGIIAIVLIASNKLDNF